MLGKNHGFLSGEDLSFNQAIDPLTRGIICIIIASWRYDIIQQKLLLNPQIGHDHNESSGQKKTPLAQNQRLVRQGRRSLSGGAFQCCVFLPHEYASSIPNKPS